MDSSNTKSGKLQKLGGGQYPSAHYVGPVLFLLYIKDLPDDLICDIDIYADDTLYSKCDQASDLCNN